MHSFLEQAYILQLIAGAWVTIKLAFSSLFLGLALGVIFALAETLRLTWVQKPFYAFISLLRGLPELLVLFFIYFGLGALLPLFFKKYGDISTFLVGVITLGLIFGAYASQVFRGAFAAVPFGQIEAAQALGLSPIRVWFAVRWPLAWRFALPGLTNLWLVILKDTALVSLIGLAEVMNRAQLAASSTAKPFFYYLAACCIYLALTSVSQIFLNFLHRQADKHLLIEH
jgi:His/Glu/Gln/Arg/opine family amino acid ABC transporter permease subunit